LKTVRSENSPEKITVRSDPVENSPVRKQSGQKKKLKTVLLEYTFTISVYKHTGSNQTQQQRHKINILPTKPSSSDTKQTYRFLPISHQAGASADFTRTPTVSDLLCALFSELHKRYIIIRKTCTAMGLIFLHIESV
jgi:hypothetical protein